MHEDHFAPRVNFARVKFLHKSKKIYKYKKIKKKNYKKKKLLTKGKGNSDSKNKKSPIEIIKKILINEKKKLPTKNKG